MTRSSFALTLPFTFAALLTGCPAPSEGEGEGGVGEGEGEGEGEGTALTESEPNDGAVVTDVNALPLDASMSGAIASGADVDIFHVDTVPGTLYHVALSAPGPLDGHLTVLDAGRDGHAAGADYARLERAPDGPNASLFFMAFGVGGDLVVVRDAHGVDGAGVGGADFTYRVVVSAVDLTPTPLAFPSTTTDALDEVGGVKLYSFDAVNGADFTVDLTASGDLDARLFVYAQSEQSWIVRNDDRAVDDKNPKLDAFFPVGGPVVLVVESAAERATDLGYTLTTTGNAP